MQQFSLLNSNKFNVVPFLKSKHMHHESPFQEAVFPTGSSSRPWNHLAHTGQEADCAYAGLQAGGG